MALNFDKIIQPDFSRRRILRHLGIENLVHKERVDILHYIGHSFSKNWIIIGIIRIDLISKEIVFLSKLDVGGSVDRFNLSVRDSNRLLVQAQVPWPLHPLFDDLPRFGVFVLYKGLPWIDQFPGFGIDFDSPSRIPVDFDRFRFLPSEHIIGAIRMDL